MGTYGSATAPSSSDTGSAAVPSSTDTGSAAVPSNTDTNSDLNRGSAIKSGSDTGTLDQRGGADNGNFNGDRSMQP
jgi:hypothetical protein